MSKRTPTSQSRLTDKLTLCSKQAFSKILDPLSMFSKSFPLRSCIVIWALCFNFFCLSKEYAEIGTKVCDEGFGAFLKKGKILDGTLANCTSSTAPPGRQFKCVVESCTPFKPNFGTCQVLHGPSSQLEDKGELRSYTRSSKDPKSLILTVVYNTERPKKRTFSKMYQCPVSAIVFISCSNCQLFPQI
ncbi:hypothetical protein O181_019087 [Austropuccinia psidii MF-1]|uniref:Uncharacterized protein n=1 Tax=Austropuccinia psidii MF-1 TaxID=1389203 RepID=A0A9Q3CAU3_9BASI|nr:hypothetical protein [Austropuccinia psidii MF-1]